MTSVAREFIHRLPIKTQLFFLKILCLSFLHTLLELSTFLNYDFYTSVTLSVYKSTQCSYLCSFLYFSSNNLRANIASLVPFSSIESYCSSKIYISYRNLTFNTRFQMFVLWLISFMPCELLQFCVSHFLPKN